MYRWRESNPQIIASETIAYASSATSAFVRMVGVEPTDYGLSNRCLYQFGYIRNLVGMMGVEPTRYYYFTSVFKTNSAANYDTTPFQTFVLSVGIEPTNHLWHMFLRHTCLPIPPRKEVWVHRPMSAYYILLEDTLAIADIFVVQVCKPMCPLLDSNQRPPPCQGDVLNQLN
jgi:hypothetical protein